MRGGGLFLAFEGVEGSGKSTQARLLADKLSEWGIPVVHAREPGSTPLGERIRGLVLQDADLQIPARSELFLMLAARAAFVEQVIEPALSQGKVVIADRYQLSTFAYQGFGRELELEAVRRINAYATDGRSPDLTLFMDLDPRIGADRQRAASKSQDRMESERDNFHARVGEGYRTLAGVEEGVVRFDASGGIEQIHGEIVALLVDRYPETFPPGGVIT